MSISDTITQILNDGVVELSIMKDPKADSIIIQAKHFITTGPGANRANVVHQVEDGSLVASVERLKKAVDQANEMRSRVVQLKTAKL